VLEPISGYLLLAAHLREDSARFGGSWNFGPSSADVRTVADVANAISDGLGLDPAETAASTPCPPEAQRLQLNCDKAHQLLGWRPRWGVDKALEATAEWYKAIACGCDARTVTAGQIHEYFAEMP